MDDLAEHLVGFNATKSVEAVELFVPVGDRRGPSGFRIETKNDELGTYCGDAARPSYPQGSVPHRGRDGSSDHGGVQLGVHKFMGAKGTVRGC